MLRKKWKLLKNQKGLTLVELLAVIVILGVIAAIAIPSIGGVVKNSKINADKESESLLRETAIRYLTDVDPDGNGKLSDGTTAVSGLGSSYQSGTASTVTVSALQAQGYLRTIPKKQSITPEAPYDTIPVIYNAGNGWDSPTATAITTTTTTP